MTELLTAAQMRAIEAAAIASGEVTGLELMERAGRGVVAAIFEEWPELKAGSFRAVVLCGPGNNGGDGFVVARLLKEWGWEVEVFLYGDPERLPPDARVNYERWRGLGEVKPIAFPIATDDDYDEFMSSAYRMSDTSIVIDALFGLGFRGDLSGLLPIIGAIGMYEHFQDLMPARCVSIDIPSGLNADTGAAQKGPEGSDIPRLCAHARLTVTFHTPKFGHLIQDGPQVCGALHIADIGLPQYASHAKHRSRTPEEIHTVGPGKLFALAKDFSAHKYTHGHALILSGGAGNGGAARLAARGALRIGAGLVTLGCPPEALTENAARLDAVMLRPVADADALRLVLEDQRITALCLGPGFGTGEREVAQVAVALGVGDQRAAPDPGGAGSALPGGGSGAARRAAGRSLVLDADALTILAHHPDIFAALHEGCVLTPHAGEFARLFPDIAEKLAAPATKGPAYSKVDATREAARRAGCVVLYKGPDTVIADPSGRCSINSAHYDRAAPWLATAGSGDVLSGFITGLLARGFAPMQAAETAAWLHVDCALKFGPGLIAEDLPEQLPAVFRDLGL